MKKFLLAAAAVTMAVSANAQAVATFMDAKALVPENTATLNDGAVLATSEYGELTLTYGDDVKKFTPINVRDSIVIDGTGIKITDGITGNASCKFNSYSAGLEGGYFYTFEAKKNGYITIVTKMNPNKEYGVMQNFTPWAYTLGGAFFTTKEDKTLQKFTYSQPALADGAIDCPEVPEDNNPYFVVKGSSFLPRLPYVTANMLFGTDYTAETINEGTGFLIFKVESGKFYQFGAKGSKMSTNGFIYTEEAPKSIVLLGGGLPECAFTYGESAVNDMSVPVLDENAPVYNVQGMKVGEDAKGILIRNGKKFVRF